MEVIENLIRQTAFFQDGIDWRNYVMILVAFIFLYLAIKKGYEPLLLLPIAFGMLLANIYPLIIQDGGLLNYFFKLDEWSILPSLIFLGVGAMTDFGPLIANPKSFLLGAAAQFGIFAAYILALLWGFNGGEAAAVSIIGGADGPTSIFLAGKLQQGHLMGSIAVAAYSYMALVPIVQLSSNLVGIVLMIGIVLLAMGGSPWVLGLGIGLFAVTTAFAFITLPVEFDASARALKWLDRSHLMNYFDHGKAKSALFWAAMTYVVGALSSLAMLLYYVFIFLNARGRE